MKYNLALIGIFFICVIWAPGAAYARIDIVPRKIVMESRDRNAEITVLNLEGTAGVFQISIIAYRQSEDGVYTKLDAPLSPDFDPAKIVRYSPRQFTLPSGGRQKIRISLRKPADLPVGEYRFHIKAQRYDAEEDTSKVSRGSGKSVSLKMNTAVAIPVIVRNGNELSAKARLGDAVLVANQGQKPTLQMTIYRSGNESLLGAVKAFWKPQNGKERQIGVVSNLNLFTEITKRNISIPLSELPSGAGKIRVVYIDDQTKDILDEIVLQR